jgi:hypothetical protein
LIHIAWDQENTLQSRPEPQGYFDVIFTEVHARVSAYLKTTFGLSTGARR